MGYDSYQISMHYHPFGSGGQQLYVEELRLAMSEIGVESAVIQPRRAEGAPNWVIQLKPARGIRRISAHASWYWFTFQLLRYRRVLIDSKIVIVHYPFHLMTVPSTARSVVLSHGVDWPIKPRSLTDKYKKYIACQCRERMIPTVANDTDFFRRIGINVAVGQKPYSMVNKHSWYIPNAVDTSVFMDTRCTRRNVILVPRNIRKSRGIHLAIEAFNHFLSNNKSFNLIIAGGQNTGAYYEYCRALVSRYSLQNNVQFLGEVDREHMRVLYQEAMLTLIPTLAYEGTSYSALEAMACGSATLSTDIGGLADLPTEKAGADPIEMARRLEELLANRQEYAGRQRDMVERDFDIQRWRAAWKDVFEWRMGFRE